MKIVIKRIMDKNVYQWATMAALFPAACKTDNWSASCSRKASKWKKRQWTTRKAIRSCLKAGDKYINKTRAMKSHSVTSHSTLQQGHDICFARRVMVRCLWDTSDYFELLWFPLNCCYAEPLYLAGVKKVLLFLHLAVTCPTPTKALVIVLQNTSNLCLFSTLMALAEALHETSE